MRADQIPTLEMDKKRLIEKEKVYNQQIEQAKKELEAMRDKEKELQAKVDDLENSAIAAGTPSNKQGGFKKMLPTVATPSSQSNQQRRTSTAEYFKRLSMTSLNKRESVGGSRQSQAHTGSMSFANNADLQKQIQLTEESFQSVIVELQKDRMALKGKTMLERMKRLEAGNGPMAQFIGKQRNRQDAFNSYSREEQVKLEGALEAVEGLKSKVKKEMALLRVIDITQHEEQRGGTLSHSEKINYMVVKAKDQVNDAFSLLFAKDSKLIEAKTYQEVQN